VNPYIQDEEIWPQETRNIPVSYGVKHISISGTISASLTLTHLRTVQTTAEGTPFSGSINAQLLCDF